MSISLPVGAALGLTLGVAFGLLFGGNKKQE